MTAEFSSPEKRAEHLAALEVEKKFREQTGRDTKGVQAEITRIKKQKRDASAAEDAADAGGEE